MTEPRLSIVVPAHDEAVIGRLLGALADGRSPGDELVVVCNGCTDRTAEVARGFPDVHVEELPSGGKPAALNAGDRCVSTFPRFYVDADVVTTSDSGSARRGAADGPWGRGGRTITRHRR